MSTLQRRYTALDLAIIGVVAAVLGIIYNLISGPYYVVKAALGPMVAKMLFYGIWFMAAPLAASLVKKPGSAVLSEFLAAMIEALTGGYFGTSVVIYGLGQGLASEAAYTVFKYSRWGLIQAILSGAFAGPVAVLLDVLVWGSAYTPDQYVVYTIISTISGAIYGAIAYLVAKSIRK